MGKGGGGRREGRSRKGREEPFAANKWSLSLQMGTAKTFFKGSLYSGAFICLHKAIVWVAG